MTPMTLALAFLLAAAAPTDEDCLTCHGDKGAQASSGRSIYVDAARHERSVHGALGCVDCHTGIRDLPHAERLKKPACADCHEDAAKDVTASLHAPLGAEACSACHDGPHSVARAAQPAGTQCASCHADAVKAYRSSVHAAMGPDHDGAVCGSCHGPAHKLLPPSDPASPVSRKKLPETCGSCHANPDFLTRHKIALARPVEAYKLSVHGRALEAGNDKAASCSDCHDSHAVLPARDPRSKINHWSVGATCGACHAEIQKTYADSVHGQASARGVRGSPVCTDCHGEHDILAPSEPGSLVNPARVSSVTCGHCHEDERLAARYNLPADKVPAFRDSYHGLASRAGSLTAANCASCHGVHNILPSSDARSTIHPANLGRTCGTCHPGAGQRFAIGPVHVRPASSSEHPVVRFIRVAYLWLIPLTLGFMLLHHGLDFWAKLRRRARVHDDGEELPRMGLHFRVAHWLVIVSFPVLVVTGFALKFPEAWWAAPLLRFEGQWAVRGWIHRAAAVVLVLSFVYHLVHLAVSKGARRLLPAMIPRVRDVSDLVGTLRHNLGRTSERPRLPAVSYVEKLEYLAFVWGTLIMAVSGFLLWFNTWALRHVPTWVLDASTAIHYYEAILATLAILIWHFYTVIFDPDVYPMDRAWLTGKVSAEHLRQTRPEYYRALVEAQARRDQKAKAEE
jgi:cytochrome b subunit of formate dehydrogenase